MQGGVTLGGEILNFGGGSDNPGPNGGGNTVRTFYPCTDQKCDITEVRSHIICALRPVLTLRLWPG